MESETFERTTKHIESLSPSISVIVPVYNVESYIEHCVESILKQTFTDFELLLIDDGSTDGSSKLCDRYCEKDSRCRTIHKKNNKSEADARNMGLDFAVGDYIAFIDADDYIHPQYLEILYKAVCENKCEIAIANFESVPNMMYYENYDLKKCYNTKCVSQKNLMVELFSKILFMVVWGKMYKRELLQRSRFKNLYMASDVEFNSRAYQIAQKAVLVDAKLYYWMNRPFSITRSLFSQRNIDAIDCYKIALDNIQKNKTMYRAYALQRLYKVILYTRYNTTLEFKSAVRSKVSPIVSCTISEFIRNRYIPFIKKCSLLLFYYMPFLYRLFRWWLEKQAKYR